MELQYSFVEVGGGIIFRLEPNEKVIGYHHNIGGWLSCDVASTGWRDLAKVKEFLTNPNEEEVMLGSNAYTVLVHKDTTTISYDFEEENPEMVPCTLPTEMLCEILEIWIKAYEEHREKTKKKEE